MEGFEDTLTVPSLDNDPWLDTDVGPYRIVERLGQGGMGTVYRAHDGALKRDVAVKILHENLTTDPEAVSRFIEEARTSARLDHPNILGVLMIGEARDRRWVAMPLMTGGSLAERVATSGPIPGREALEIIGELAGALGAAHAEGVTHRDVKPENVMADKSGRLRLSDFGMASMRDGAESRLTRDGELLGTPYTMAPEQCSGLAVGRRSDIYSLGVTLYHMLTGDWPFKGETSVAVLVKHVCEDLPVEPMKAAGVDDGTIDLVRRMTAKDPVDRHRDMAAVRADIRSLLTSGRLPQRHRRRRGPAPLRLKRFVHAVLALVIVAGVWAGWKHVTRPGTDGDGGPEEVVLAPPEERIDEIARETAPHRKILFTNDLGNERRWLEVLGSLDVLEGLRDELELIDPVHPDLVDRTQELEDIRFEWVTRISGAIVDPLVEEARFDLSLVELKRLPETLLELPRVAQYGFEVMCRHTDALIAEGTVASLTEAGDWLDRAWKLSVPTIKLSELVDREERWRKAVLQREQDLLGDLRRTRWYRGWQLALSLARDEKLVAARHRLDSLREDAGDGEALAREKARVRELNAVRVSFDAAMSLGDHAMAQQAWLAWRELAPTPSSREAWRRLEAGRHLRQGTERIAAGDVDGALESACLLMRVDPNHTEAAEFREQLVELAARRNRVTEVESALAAHLEFGRGLYDRGIARLEAARIPPEIVTRSRMAALVQAAFVAGDWDRVVDEAAPWRSALDLDGRTRWMVGRALRERASDRLQKGDHRGAWADIGEAIVWCGEQLGLRTVEEAVRDSWTQQALQTMSTAEARSDSHLEAGDPVRARDVLSRQQEELGHEVLDSSPEVQAMAASLRRRHEDLDRYLVDVAATRAAVANRDWTAAGEALERAVNWQDIPAVTGRLRRDIDHGRALEKLESVGLDDMERLRLSWTAWHNRPGEDAGERERHARLRLQVAGAVARSVTVSRDAAAAALEIRDLPRARGLVDVVTTRLLAVSTDLARDPALEAAGEFLVERSWWRDLAVRLDRAERADRLAVESLKKYAGYIEAAAGFEKKLELDKALDSLKNARLHAGHLGERPLSDLDSRITSLEARVADARTTAVERDRERKRREGLTVLAKRVTAAVGEGKWEEADRAFTAFRAKARPDDVDLLGEKRTLAAWAAWILDRRENQKQWQVVLDQVRGLAPAERIEALMRFKRVNAGNHYVRSGAVQSAIDEAVREREGWKQSLRRDIRRRVGELLVSGDVPAAQQIVIDGLARLPDDPELGDRLAELLDGDRVIFKGGSFPVGSEPGEGVGEHEGPVWRRLVPPFALGRHEVSNLQYARFVRETGAGTPAGWPDGRMPTGSGLKPVRGVSWNEAAAYARWVGARLPNEFEWEWAARDGGELQRWPWGNDEDVQRGRVDAKTGAVAGIFEFPKGRSAKGLSHLAGNVAEWTTSPWLTYPGADMFGGERPRKMIVEGARVVRGGSLFNRLNDCRTTARAGRLPDVRRQDIGFRLCWNVEGDIVVEIPKKDRMK